MQVLGAEIKANGIAAASDQGIKAGMTTAVFSRWEAKAELFFSISWQS